MSVLFSATAILFDWRPTELNSTSETMLQCTLTLNILQNVLEKVILSDCVTDKTTDKNVRPDWYLT